MPVPGMAIAAGAGSAIGALGDWMGGSESRKYEELMREISQWKFGEGKDLFAKLKKMYGSGTTIAPGKRASMIGKNQQAMSGAFRRILAAMGQRGDMRNPALQKMFSQTYMPMEAEFGQKLDMFDMSEMSKLRQLLMSSTFGG
jgi:hypothetical protein